MAEAKVMGEIRSGQLIISLTADKGSQEEADALGAMKELVSRVVDAKLQYKTFTRNTPDGDRVDQVRIQL